MSEPRNAYTDPNSGLRFYRWEGEPYLSVTSVRRLVGMAHNLHNWTLSKVIERALDQRDVLDSILARPAKPRERVRDANVLKEAKSFLRAAATEERDAAGDRGTRVHEAIETGLAPSELDDEARPYYEQYLAFRSQKKYESIYPEAQVFNKLGYAGSIDDLGRMGGDTWMLDYKTSKGVYLDHAVQIIAYAMGDLIGEDEVVNTEATDFLKGIDKMGVLHLAPDHWELIEIRPSKELFAAFVGSLTFALFLYRNDENIEGLIANTERGSA